MPGVIRFPCIMAPQFDHSKSNMGKGHSSRRSRWDLTPEDMIWLKKKKEEESSSTQQGKVKRPRNEGDADAAERGR
ncbi:Protein of unknown function [Gryllus bimaculatus]|nr:Protein of unknown function [Gryllus bimaculatus]